MIDFNWTEVLTLAVLAVILFGPEKLPDFARRAARIIAYLRKVSEDARGQLREELGPEFDDLKLSDLNPKNFVARHLLTASDKEDLLAIRDELRSAGELATGGVDEVRHEIEGMQASGGAGEVAAAASTLVAHPPTPFDPEAT